MAYNEQNRRAGAKPGAPGKTAAGTAGFAGGAGTADNGTAGYEFGTELAGGAPAGAGTQRAANRAGNTVAGARQKRPGQE